MNAAKITSAREKQELEETIQTLRGKVSTLEGQQEAREEELHAVSEAAARDTEAKQDAMQSLTKLEGTCTGLYYVVAVPVAFIWPTWPRYTYSLLQCQSILLKTHMAETKKWWHRGLSHIHDAETMCDVTFDLFSPLISEENALAVLELFLVRY